MAFKAGTIYATLRLNTKQFNKDTSLATKALSNLGKGASEFAKGGGLLNTLGAAVPQLRGLTIGFQVLTRSAKLFLSPALAIPRVLSRISQAVFNLRNAILGTGLVFAIRTLTKTAAEVDRLTTSFSSLAFTFSGGGGFTSVFNSFNQAAEGTLSKLQLMQAANVGVQLNVARNVEEFQKLIVAGRRLGQVMGRTATEGIYDLAQGIGRQSRLILDNLGIIISMERAQEEFAQSLNKTVGALTSQESRIAFNNAAFEAIRKKLAALGPEQDTLSLQISRVSASFQDLFANIAGNAIPALRRLFAVIEDLQGKDFNFTRNISNGIVFLVDSLTDFLSDSGPGILSFFSRLAEDIVPFLEKAKGLSLDLALSVREAFSGEGLTERLSNLSVLFFEGFKAALDSFVRLSAVAFDIVGQVFLDTIIRGVRKAGAALPGFGFLAGPVGAGVGLAAQGLGLFATSDERLAKLRSEAEALQKAQKQLEQEIEALRQPSKGRGFGPPDPAFRADILQNSEAKLKSTIEKLAELNAEIEDLAGPNASELQNALRPLEAFLDRPERRDATIDLKEYNLVQGQVVDSTGRVVNAYKSSTKAIEDLDAALKSFNLENEKTARDQDAIALRRKFAIQDLQKTLLGQENLIDEATLIQLKRLGDVVGEADDRVFQLITTAKNGLPLPEFATEEQIEKLDILKSVVSGLSEEALNSIGTIPEVKKAIFDFARASEEGAEDARQALLKIVPPGFISDDILNRFRQLKQVSVETRRLLASGIDVGSFGEDITSRLEELGFGDVLKKFEGDAEGLRKVLRENGDRAYSELLTQVDAFANGLQEIDLAQVTKGWTDALYNFATATGQGLERARKDLDSLNLTAILTTEQLQELREVGKNLVDTENQDAARTQLNDLIALISEGLGDDAIKKINEQVEAYKKAVNTAQREAVSSLLKFANVDRVAVQPEVIQQLNSLLDQGRFDEYSDRISEIVASLNPNLLGVFVEQMRKYRRKIEEEAKELEKTVERNAAAIERQRKALEAVFGANFEPESGLLESLRLIGEQQGVEALQKSIQGLAIAGTLSSQELDSLLNTLLDYTKSIRDLNKDIENLAREAFDQTITSSNRELFEEVRRLGESDGWEAAASALRDAAKRAEDIEKGSGPRLIDAFGEYIKSLYDAAKSLKEAAKDVSEGVVATIRPDSFAPEVQAQYDALFDTIQSRRSEITENEIQQLLQGAAAGLGLVGEQAERFIRDFDGYFDREEKAIETRLSRIGGGFSQAITDGLQAGSVEEALKSLANTFVTTLEDSLESAFDDLFEFLRGQDGFLGQLGGFLGSDFFSGALGLASGLLQQGAGSTVSELPVEEIATSSAAVRGVVAGPQSVAISQVGSSIREANRGVEQLLREIRDAILTNQGGSINSGGLGAAGTV